MLLSIVTVCFNDLDGLKKTYSSVKDCITDNIEWIVVDGDSFDGTKDYLNDFKENNKSLNFRYISEKDDGIYDAMNKGVSLANGDYFIFLNAGDELINENMSAWLEVISKNDVDVLYAGADLIFSVKKLVYRPPRNVKKYIWHGLPANHQATVYNKIIFNKLKYTTDLKICGDYEMAAKISLCFDKFYYVDLPIVRFAIGGVSFQSPVLQLFEHIAVQVNVLKLNLGLIFLSTLKRIISLIGVNVIYYLEVFK